MLWILRNSRLIGKFGFPINSRFVRFSTIPKAGVALSIPVLGAAIAYQNNLKSSTFHFPLRLYASTIDNNRKVRDMFEAIKYGRIDRLEGLLNSPQNQLTLKEAANQRHEFGWTLLQAAAINANKEAVKVLVKAGADVNAGDEFSNFTVVTRDKKAHPMQVYKARQDEFHEGLSMTNSFYGFTALHYAVLADDIEIVEVLINAGADPLQKDSTGHRPSEYALPSMQKKFSEFEKRAEESKKEKLRLIRKLKPINLVLSENIVGQAEAIEVVSAAVRRKESGWCSEDKPLVFLFLGSSGVGKTELAKQLAKYVETGRSVDSENGPNFIRIDMSEYQQKHEVAKFIGSPPGYVGYEDGGQLTEALTKNPNAVVLLDEVDKAHLDVLTVLLQLFDEGRLTDGQGKTVDGRNAIYIMTSNLANTEIGEFDGVELSKTFREQVVKPILKEHFKRDEFLGRINEIVYFLPFTPSQVIELVERELRFWADLALKRHSIKLEWDENAVNKLANGFDKIYGARSLKHEVDRKVVSLIARAHESGKIKNGDRIMLTTDNGSIKLRKMKSGLLGGSSFEDISSI